MDPRGSADPPPAVLDEIQRILDTPLADLVDSPRERVEVEKLARQAVAAPAMARLREVVAFVGDGRPATQAGNLKGADAVALARRIGTGERVPDEVRSMDDLPDTAHAFRWAAAAELLAWRGTKVVAGPRAPELERDPLSAWFTATITLLEHGLLDGFREGWRKNYVELLDAGATGLLAAIAEAGGVVPLATIEDGGWERVVAAYGYEPDDDTERRHVVRLMRAMVSQLGAVGVVARHDDEVALTGLGSALAIVAAISTDDDLDDLDLVDTDAQSLLLVCVEEMEPAEARDHLRAWCRARSADEAAAELCEALLDDEEPEVWHLGLEALGMIDPAVAEPAVQGLRPHTGLRPLVTEWRRRHGRTPESAKPG